MLRLALLLLAACLASAAHAANTPCSGKKGGVQRCVGERFLCRDGSISASKRQCMAPEPAAAPPARATGPCPCSGRQYCTGPRGGTYCLTPSGKKSYLRP